MLSVCSNYPILGTSTWLEATLQAIYKSRILSSYHVFVFTRCVFPPTVLTQCMTGGYAPLHITKYHTKLRSIASKVCLYVTTVVCMFQLPTTQYWVLPSTWLEVTLQAFYKCRVPSSYHVLAFTRCVFQQPSHTTNTSHPTLKLTLKLNPGHVMHPCGSVARG